MPRPEDADNRGPLRNSDPANGAKAITKSDANDIDGAAYNDTTSRACRGVYVGGAGDLVVTMANNDKVTFAGAVVGSVLPIRIKRLWSTGTTATLCLALL